MTLQQNQYSTTTEDGRKLIVIQLGTVRNIFTFVTVTSFFT